MLCGRSLQQSDAVSDEVLQLYGMKYGTNGKKLTFKKYKPNNIQI